MAKPGDPPTLIRFAETAAKVGDDEGAISALERLLLIEGDQPRIRLELGLLYVRLRSYEAAQSYLEGARSSARATPEIRARASQALGEIERVHGTSRLGGDLLLGLRYSSNANSGPNGTIRASGASAVSTPSVSQRSDWSALIGANLRHRYDLGRQDSGTLETDLSLFSARQFRVAEANVGVVDLTVGPRMNPFAGDFSGVALKPFLTGRYVSVHDFTTYWAWGAGIEAAAPLGERVLGTATMLGRHREFVPNADAPNNDRSSGNEATGLVDLKIVLTPGLLMTLGANLTRYTALNGFESYWENGFGSSLSVRFADPLGLNGRLWTATLGGGVQFATYDQPNPLIDPAVSRSQTDATIGVHLSVPITQDFSIQSQASYIQRAASLNNYAYEAFNALIGISLRF